MNAILCYADGKFMSRALVMLATAGMHDPADLWLFHPEPREGEKTVGRIRMKSVIHACKGSPVESIRTSLHGYFLRYAVILWLLEHGYDAVLSLDSDILVLGSLAELWDITQKHNVAAARERSDHLPQDLCWPDQGLYAAPVWASLARTPEPLRNKLLDLIGIGPEKCQKTPYVNAGVMAWSNAPRSISLLREYVHLLPENHEWMMQVRQQDQDVLNCLLVKHGMRADVLDPDRFNLDRPGVVDRRIVHFAGKARGPIGHLWMPYLQMIREAADKMKLPMRIINNEMLARMPGSVIADGTLAGKWKAMEHEA